MNPNVAMENLKSIERRGSQITAENGRFGLGRNETLMEDFKLIVQNL